MQSIFSCKQASELEKNAKENFAIPPFLMMENAAKAMAYFICSKISSTDNSASLTSALIVCGKGNNGGDGYALARLLQNKINVTVFALEEPSAEEAKAQCEMCRKLGIKISDILELKKNCRSLSSGDFIIDCIYGTGFHGELSSGVAEIINVMNASRACKIACDIPSALAFAADYTITMGCQKLELYSDKAKNVCGTILVADLGVAREKFENQSKLHLIEPEDRNLPLRKKRAAHKGSYGHTAVLCGDKAGAAILAATAAMNFGSGLTSLVETGISNLSQFKISPSLMISDSIPKKTSCIAIGSGFTDFSEQTAKRVLEWFKSSKAPAAVLDAGILTNKAFPDFLQKLNEYDNARIILTPHLSELSRLLENCNAEDDFSVTALAENTEAKINAASFLNKRFPRTTVIMKSANTFIAEGGEVFVIADGSQSLAKGGSGDILAGMTAALLAQGYSAKDAAITAAEHHALLSQKIGQEAYNLTPEKILALL